MAAVDRLPVLHHSADDMRVMQKVLSLTGFLGFIPGIILNSSLHLNGVFNS